MGIIPGILNQNIPTPILFEKIKRFKDHSNQFEKFTDVGIDGSLNFNTFKELILLGINCFVCGSQTIFKDSDTSLEWIERSSIIKKNIKLCKSIINEEL